MAGPRIDDGAFFDLLDLERADLANVKAAVGAGDIPGAKAALVQHLKDREDPRWYFDWRIAEEDRNPDYDTERADRYARNELVSCGVWKDFGEEIDWSTNPMENQYVEWTWQLSRHPFWVTLGEAYRATGDEKYAKAYVFQLNSWIRQNERPDDDGNVPYSRWRTLETGIRMERTWFSALYHFLSSPSLDDESVVLLMKSCVEHAWHVTAHRRFGNWFAAESTGLFHVGVMFPEFKDAASWRDNAIQRLYGELDNQVYPDGAQVELASGYHQVSLRHFKGSLELAQLNGISLPDDYVSKLEKLYHYDLWAAMPNAELPALNDGGWVDVKPYLMDGFRLYPHRTDMQWMATEGKEGTRPDHNSHLFPWAGQAVMRSGWDRDDRFLLFDMGSFGFMHQHEDKLSFVLYAHGRVHVTDPGNYAYDDSIWRKYHIGAYAHNTILVDGLPQHRKGFDRPDYLQKVPMDDHWKSTDVYDYAIGSYNDPDESRQVPEGYGEDRVDTVMHTRQIVFVKPDYFVVFDTLTSRDSQTHSYESPFHIDADAVTVDSGKCSVTTRNEDGANLAIIPAAADGLSVEVIEGQEEPYVQGWVRDGQYGVRPIPTPTWSFGGEGQVTVAMVFYPFQGDRCPVTDVRWVEDESGIEIAFEGGKVDTVAVDAERREVSVQRG